MTPFDFQGAAGRGSVSATARQVNVPRLIVGGWVFAAEMPMLTFRLVEPLKKYRKSGLEHFIKFVKDLPSLSPKTIFDRLDELGYRGERSR